MTWAEFKAAVEKQGVKDDTKIDWIDWTAMDSVPYVFNFFGQRSDQPLDVTKPVMIS